MIDSKNMLKYYISRDAKAIGRTKTSSRFFGDEIWKFTKLMRKLDYISNKMKKNKLLYILPRFIYRCKYHSLSLKLGYSIPHNVCGSELALVHYGTLVISPAAKIGNNCRIHADVNIGATSGKKNVATIGDNVYIGSGVKIIGDITIADGVCLGAEAVVTKSIEEPNTTWAGVPAKKLVIILQLDICLHSFLTK